MDPTFEYMTPLVFSSVGLLLAFLWYYKTIVAPYSGFPCASFFRLYLEGKMLAHIPSAHYYMDTIIKHCKKFESEGMFLIWILQPFLFIYGEETIKVFSSEPSLLNKTYMYRVMGNVLGTGLITSTGNVWKQKRKMFNPVFHSAALKEKVPVFNENAAKLVKTLMNVEDKSSLEIVKFLKNCSFRNLTETIFGLKADDPMRTTEMEAFIDLVNGWTTELGYRAMHPWLIFKHVLQLSHWGRAHLRREEELQKITKKILLDIKESLVIRKSEGEMEETEEEFFGAPRKSLAEILLGHYQADSSFTLNDVVHEVATFIIAGYETVSYAMMWCLFLMGHHPEVQDLVYEEVGSLSENISFDELQKLKYLECVILESLRIYPTLPLYTRHLEKNVQCGKYNVPKGTNIIFVPYMYHRNSKIYPDPEKFDPERFLPGNSKKRSSDFIAFAEGMRNCIGKKFALMEMKIILAHIVRHFEITSLDRREDIQLSWGILLSTLKPLRMRLTPRHRTDADVQY